MARKQNASRPDLSPAFEKLKQAASGLPDIEPGTSYGTPALKLGKKLICRVKDADTAVLLAPLDEKEMLMAAAPGIYFETDHYKGWPALLARIHDIPLDELRHRLQQTFLRVAPKRLVKAWRDGEGHEFASTR